MHEQLYDQNRSLVALSDASASECWSGAISIALRHHPLSVRAAAHSHSESVEVEAAVSDEEAVAAVSFLVGGAGADHGLSNGPMHARHSHLVEELEASTVAARSHQGAALRGCGRTSRR